jgi:hypothetical protein
MRDRLSHVIVYTNFVSNEELPVFVGIWRGNVRGAAESIGPQIRQGLAGFHKSSTWKDLAEQLEHAGFRRQDVSLQNEDLFVAAVMRSEEDIVRITFRADGQISCQWFTHGPDDNAGVEDRPWALPRGGN